MRKLALSVLIVVLAAPLGAAQLTPGNYVVLDWKGTIWEVTPGGAISSFFTSGNQLFGVDFDAQGNLICGWGASVVRVTQAGAATTVFSGSPLSSLVGDLEVNRAGNYLVPAWSGASVLEITPGGVIVTTYATPGLRNWGLGLDEKAGHLFVTGHNTLLIDLGTGTVKTLVRPGAPIPFPQCGQLAPNANFVVGDQTANAVFEVDALGTVKTLTQSAAFSDVGEGVDWDRHHAFLLADDGVPGLGVPLLFRLDAANVLTTVTVFPTGAVPDGCAVVPELVTVPLSGNPKPGGVAAIGLNAPSAGQFKSYVCASSLGARRGIPMPGGRVFPLDFDALLAITVQNLLPSVFVNYAGNLGASGRTILQVNVPGDPNLIGLTFYTAGITLDPNAVGGVHLISTPLATSIIP